ARPAHLYHLPHRAAVLHPAFARRVPRLHPRPRMPSRRTDSQMTYNNDEHECPRPLEELAAEFDVGGMVLSPAGRWETIIDRPPFGDHPARISVYTDRTGPHYCWTFRRSEKLPYLPSWLTSQHKHVKVFELGSTLAVEVTSARSFGHGHTL